MGPLHDGTMACAELLQRGDEQLVVAHCVDRVVVQAQQAVATWQRFLVQCEGDCAAAAAVGTD